MAQERGFVLTSYKGLSETKTQLKAYLNGKDSARGFIYDVDLHRTRLESILQKDPELSNFLHAMNRQIQRVQKNMVTLVSAKRNLRYNMNRG